MTGKRISTKRVLTMFYGYPVELIARWCCVSEQTAYKYKRGILKPSKQAAALFRLHSEGRILPDSWKGWKFHKNQLFDDCGKPLSQGQLNAYQFIYQIASEANREEVHAVLSLMDNTA